MTIFAKNGRLYCNPGETGGCWWNCLYKGNVWMLLRRKFFSTFLHSSRIFHRIQVKSLLKMASKITFLIITFFGLVQAQRQGKRLQCPPGVEAGFVLSFDEIFCKSGQVWDSFQKTCKSRISITYIPIRRSFWLRWRRNPTTVKVFHLLLQ